VGGTGSDLSRCEEARGAPHLAFVPDEDADPIEKGVLAERPHMRLGRATEERARVVERPPIRTEGDRGFARDVKEGARRIRERLRQIGTSRRVLEAASEDSSRREDDGVTLDLERFPAEECDDPPRRPGR